MHARDVPNVGADACPSNLCLLPSVLNMSMLNIQNVVVFAEEGNIFDDDDLDSCALNPHTRLNENLFIRAYIQQTCIYMTIHTDAHRHTYTHTCMRIPDGNTGCAPPTLCATARRPSASVQQASPAVAVCV
jgi:hypothetical protein